MVLAFLVVINAVVCLSLLVRGSRVLSFRELVKGIERESHFATRWLALGADSRILRLDG
jgi:hypothetical protein